MSLNVDNPRAIGLIVKVTAGLDVNEVPIPTPFFRAQPLKRQPVSLWPRHANAVADAPGDATSEG